MSNLERIGKHRFSRRQITKRAFQIGSDVKTKPASGKKEKLVKTPVKDKHPMKRTRHVEETPPGLQECSSIGNVSVSFLASTPKPGKTQLSRRRPLSSVQESEISKSGSGQEKASQKTKILPQKTDKQSYKLSHPSNASDSVENLKRKSLSRSKSSETNDSSARSSSVNISKRITASSHPSKSSTVIEKSEDYVTPHTEKIKRKQSDIKGSGSTRTDDSYKKQNSSYKKKSNDGMTRKRVSDVVPAVAAKKRKVSRSETSVLVSNSKIPSYSNPPVSGKTVQMNKNDKLTIGKKTRNETEKVPENDLTVVDISLKKKGNSQIHKNKSAKLSKTGGLKQSSTRARNEEKNIPVQTVVVYQDGGNHKKSDLVDLDVALSTLTETVQTQLDDCETQKEQAAVRLLEKYLVQDISGMISDMQRVKKLQGNIKKGRQSLKERQNTLMSLQMKKSELLVNKNRQEDEKQSAENMKDINAFLENMKNFIEQL